MYVLVLVAHSWLRWVVLTVGVALLAVGARTWRTEEAWGEREDRLRKGFLRVLDAQLLLGLGLYAVLSPLPRAGLSDLGAAMGDSVLRFYSIEHAFGMVLAVAIAHIGLARAVRLQSERRARAVTLTQLAWALVTIASIPWPVAAYGRPLFRL